MASLLREVHICHILAIFLVNFLVLCNGIPVMKYGKCHDLEKQLEEREEQANVVFTGTIKDISPDYQHPKMFKSLVEVKRVFKGNNIITDVPRDHSYHRKMVTVEGLGDPKICHSNPRKYDTRIFLVNKNGHGDLRLNSSLIRITLQNLAMTDSAVKGKYPVL